MASHTECCELQMGGKGENVTRKSCMGLRGLTKRDREVVEITRSCVKIKSKLTNFMKLIRIEGYNGKYGSNP